MSELWLRAQEYADDARLLFGESRYNSACNRAYYAMFNAARALLLGRGISAADAKRHTTVWRQFSLHFVKNGPFGAAEAGSLSQIGDVRLAVDYAGRQIDRESAEAVLSSMEKFMSAATRTMQEPDTERTP